MKKEYLEAYQKFLDAWGQEAQERMAIEEMSELTKELCKKIRLIRDDFSENNEEKLKKTISNIKEEIADVLNMTEQLQIYFGVEEIDAIRDEKIKRTLKLLDEVK